MTQLIREAIENNQPIKLFRSLNNDGSTITLIHDKEWIKAQKDTDAKKEYHINLINGKILAHYYNNREDKYVKIGSVAQWFNKSEIVTRNIKFAKLVLFNMKQRAFKNYTNPVRFIIGLANPVCSIFEKWEAIGVNIIEVENMLDDINKGRILQRGYYRTRECLDIIEKAPNEIEKEMLQIIKEYKQLSISELNRYCNDDYNYHKHQILLKLRQYEKQADYTDLFLVPKYRYTRSNFEFESLLTSNNYSWDRRKLINLIDKYNLDIDRFIKYLRQIKDFEHTDIEWICDNYTDYLDAELKLRGGKITKITKYPTNLVQTHHNRVSVLRDIEREKLRLKNEEQKEKDRQIYASYKHLAYHPKNSEYCIVVPEGADDIIEEGNRMNHCVGGYIGRISDEETFILFMRLQGAEELPFITVELKHNTVCTALGKNNRRLEDEEKRFLQKFAERKHLNYTAYIRV